MVGYPTVQDEPGRTSNTRIALEPAKRFWSETACTKVVSLRLLRYRPKLGCNNVPGFPVMNIGRRQYPFILQAINDVIALEITLRTFHDYSISHGCSSVAVPKFFRQILRKLKTSSFLTKVSAQT
jgi:hypothetical protein